MCVFVFALFELGDIGLVCACCCLSVFQTFLFGCRGMRFVISFFFVMLHAGCKK